MKKFKKAKSGTTKLLMSVRKMPPSYHTLPGENFSVNDSEVVKWLMSQPGVRNFIFSKMSVYGLIEYDPTTQKWRGVDYGK